MSVLATLVVVATARGRQEDVAADRPVDEQGYLGLALREIPGGHVVVSWVFPGPLEGEGLTSPRLARPDLIVSVDGRSMTVDEIRDYVRGKRPGERIELHYRTARQRGGTIPDALDHDPLVRTLEVTLSSRGRWIGTVGRRRGHDTAVAWSEPAMLEPFEDDNVLGRAVRDGNLAAPLRTLLDVFLDHLERDEDHHGLSRVRAAFEQPLRLPELAQLVIDDAAGVPAEPAAGVLRLVTRQLDLPPRALTRPPEGRSMLDAVAAAMSTARRQRQLAFAALELETGFPARCVELLRVPRRGFYLTAVDAGPQIGVIRASMDVDLEALVDGWATLLALTSLPVEPDTGTRTAAIADELATAIDGPVQAVVDLGDAGIVVLGSSADNRYDLGRLAAVIDPGGDDVYDFATRRTGDVVVIDAAGDDRYLGGPQVGPGGALLGVGLVDDRGGDDRYEGGLLAAGAAMFGFALLLDRGGDDVYLAEEWSIGAGCYGAGVLVDLGGGADAYTGAFLCQGVGGPRGLGAVIDDGGRDLYRVNGPEPSAYGTPAVYQSFGQGMGFGFRHYAAGGIGLIADLGGDDRYEAGEFAQGGAYYHGLGVLYDRSGSDLYYGNRYGQGFGVHQAAGALVDDGGDDTYWSMTAASQGAAWDVGTGLLLDRAGDDAYRCDGLGQGGAAMQGIALLLDLGGVDRYSAGGGATQGESGVDTYHFHETGAHSFSLLLDLGGGADRYSRGRENGAVTYTGAPNADDPQRATLHGLVIDR